MKILHVIPTLWSGAGEVVTHLCEQQARKHHVLIATSARAGPLRDWPSYRRRLHDAGVRTVRIDTFSREPHTFWSSVAALEAVTREWRPQIVHTHAGVPACALACAAPGTPLRHIAQIYSWGRGRPAWMNQMDIWGIRQAERVVCSARRYQKILREGGVPVGKLVYLRLGIDVERVDAVVGRRRRAPHAQRLGFVGRIEPRKGQLELIRAFGLLHRRLPGLHLDLVGSVADAAYAALCRDEARRLGVAAQVTWHGYVKRPLAIVADWRLFLSLSSDEGQGLAVQEAMALGIPVFALRAAGIEDYVMNGRTGILADSSQANRVSAAVLKALREPATLSRVAAAGAKFIRRNYSWERFQASLDRLYRGADPG